MNNKLHLFRLLKKVSCFSGLEEETLRLVQNKMQPVIFKSGDIICTEGETGDWMFIIDAGEVSVLRQGKNGELVEIATLHSGDIGGEMSLFGQGTRTATLRARENTKIWKLDYATFQQLIDEHAALAKGLLSNLSQHLSRESSVLASLLSQDLDPRFKVAIFDSKSYVEAVFRERNQYNYSLQFFRTRLSPKTVTLAAGYKVICVFVNDDLSDSVIKELNALGVKMIALRCAGFNNVDLSACEHYGISVTRVPAYSPFAVAEHAVALMMALNRHIQLSHNRVREGNFSLEGLMGFDIHGRTAGVIGTGKIGSCLLKILHGFGCRLLAYDISPQKNLIEHLGVQYVDLDILLAESDIISLHVPLMSETYHMIDATAIRKMKPGIMLINTSRGGLIDTKELINGLKSGHIGYAGLDVYEEEDKYFFEDFSSQVITDDMLARLTTFNNVMITSHQGFLTREAMYNIADTTLANIRAFELGKRMTELPNFVTTVD